MKYTINMNFRKLFGMWLTVIILVTGGCKELDLAPEDTFTDLNFWNSEDKALSVLNTAYSQIFNSNYFFYNEGLSDNAFNGRGDNAGAASLGAGTYDPSLGRLKEEWDNHYQGIKTCNILLENIDRIPHMNEDNRNRMKAEARFIRAFLHFQLMTWFGDVPLLAQDLSLEEALTIARTPRAQVLSFLFSELEEAMPFLPLNTGLPSHELGRITQGAAAALKARIHLYEGNWEEVLQSTSMLISGDVGSYNLFPSYGGLFLPQNQNSSEDILSLQYVPQLRTWGQFFDMAPLSAGARLNALAPTQELVESYVMTNGLPIDHPNSGYEESDPYANRDPRLTYTVVYDGYHWENPDGTVRTIYIRPGSDPSGAGPDEYAPGSSSTVTGYYTRKYYDPTHLPQFASGLNLMLFRYADVLLMHAEAVNELGQMDAQTWEMTVGELRGRAGFTNPAALSFPSGESQSGLREIIRNERRSELAMEGLRIFDIRRWQIAEEVLNGWVRGAQFGPPNENDGYLQVNLRTFDPGRHYLWPIPRQDRNINPNLTQNPGWD